MYMVKVHQTDEEQQENKPVGEGRNDHLFATVKSALKGMS